jgi:hypothetical protein
MMVLIHHERDGGRGLLIRAGSVASASEDKHHGGGLPDRYYAMTDVHTSRERPRTVFRRVQTAEGRTDECSRGT